MHHTSLEFHRPDVITDPLYAITTVFNPQRYRTRWKHYKPFEKHILDSGAYLITIEAAYGNRAHVVTERVSERHFIIQVRTKSQIWLKEALVNKAIQELTTHIDPNWKYACYIDADLTFGRKDWVGETIHQLQHYAMVQMFSQIAQLNPNREIIGTGASFMAGYLKAYKALKIDLKHNTYTDGIVSKLEWQGAPGGAWAVRRDAWEHLGGLIESVILGSADYFMALGLFGYLHIDERIGYHPYFMEELLTWQDNAMKHLKKNIGLVQGMVLHEWHGKMVDRGYNDRWKILVKHNFNPRTDIRRDAAGLTYLTDDKPDFKLDLDLYFSKRNEDSIDV
jgi:hypothetical protein